jgi:hypothetical protein
MENFNKFLSHKKLIIIINFFLLLLPRHTRAHNVYLLSVLVLVCMSVQAVAYPSLWWKTHCRGGPDIDSLAVAGLPKGAGQKGGKAKRGRTAEERANILLLLHQIALVMSLAVWYHLSHQHLHSTITMMSHHH